jgi:hypothetical protein
MIYQKKSIRYLNLTIPSQEEKRSALQYLKAMWLELVKVRLTFLDQNGAY